MKNNIKIVVAALMLLASVASFGQAPGLFNYQAVLRNANGTAMANQSVNLVFDLYNNPTGAAPILYQETFSATTNANGVVNLQVGANPSVGNLSNLNWSAGPYYVNILLNNVSIYGSGPLAQLVSVPYALHANKADSALYANTASDPTPPGTIVAFAGANVPTGWLLCDGRAVNISDYPALFNAIGTAWGNANNTSGQFNLPETRGYFLRGVLGSGGADPDAASRTAINTGGNTGNNVGSAEGDIFASHNHFQFKSGSNYNVPSSAQSYSTITSPANVASFSTTTDFAYALFTLNGLDNGVLADNFPGSMTGGSETRPKNVYVNYIIKY